MNERALEIWRKHEQALLVRWVRSAKFIYLLEAKLIRKLIKGEI
jgi:hypothetical protein